MNGLKAIIVVTALSGAALLAGGLWIPAKALLAYGLLDLAHDGAQATGAPVKPWSWADFGVIGKLAIGDEKIHVLDRATNQAMAFGAGRHEEYAPHGPHVLSGHRDTHFAVLEHVKQGDEFSYQSSQGDTIYRVSETRIFDIREGVLLPPAAGEIMLMTCWPFDAIDPNTTKRYLVLAQKL